jgi:hypothetical protein
VLTILKNCTRAMPQDGRLLIVDLMRMPEAAAVPHQMTVVMDLQILATLGGRERTQAEFSALLTASGLRLASARATSSPLWLFDAAHA